MNTSDANTGSPVRDEPGKAEDPDALVGDAMVLRRDADGEACISCVECDYRYGSATEDPKLGAVMAERRMDDLSPLNSPGMVDRIVIREFYCPGCGLIMALNVQEVGDPIRAELLLDG